MAQHNEVGKKGEDLAVAFLEDKQYRILDRNWRYSRIEIDIVTLDQEEIVFVEVKTRTSREWGNPEEAVSESKMQRMVDAADAYLYEKDINRSVRFDVISIVITNKETIIEHIEDAFFAPLN